MKDVLAGVKVLEVAAWTFVPAAGAVLAEWGAEVIKVEHPNGGDPQRGLISSGLVPAGAGGVNYMIEVPNRGKRSIGIDIGTEEGHEVLLKLAEECDVFLTHFLPSVRKKLRIDVEDIRAANPNIIYVRGTGHGSKGPDADRPGYDGVSYWIRGGLAASLTPPELDYPIAPRAAFGDVMGGLTLAGGVAAALFHRERTGEPSVVDVSLIGLALWNLGPDVTAAKLYEGQAPPIPKFDRAKAPNPLVGNYKTQDGRFITLMCLQSDKYWTQLCDHLGHPELATDERFSDQVQRFHNRETLVAILDEIFAGQPYDDWKKRLSTFTGAWGPMQTPLEVHDDPAVIANGYLPTVTTGNGAEFVLPANPVQFDETPPQPTASPEHGQHTEEILLELGIEWDEIERLKTAGAVL